MIGPLSNGNVSLLVNMARYAGLPWDMIFSCELFKLYKPHPDTYLGVARLMGVKPHQVMMCAAHDEDLIAAQSVGLRTAFVSRPDEFGPEARTGGPSGRYDLNCRDFGELVELLDGERRPYYLEK